MFVRSFKVAAPWRLDPNEYCPFASRSNGVEISHAVKLEKSRRVNDSGDVGAAQDKSVALERERPDSVQVIKELGKTVPVPVTTLAPLLPVILKVFHGA
jgi:hypothetical protein